MGRFKIRAVDGPHDFTKFTETMKRIVLMGATSGIGLALAERLAADGHRIGVAGRKTEVMRELQKRYPEQIVYSRIDVTDAEAPRKLHDLIERLGGMDVYFHIAGIGFSNEALETDRELLTMQTNVVGFTRMVDTAFRYFRDHGGRGHIGAITSVAGTKGIAQIAAYSASKRFQQTYLTALEQLARRQRLQIRFTDIRPGWIRTPLLDADQEYPMSMTLGYAVPRIHRAMVSGRRLATVDWRWRLLTAVWRMIPDALWVRMRIPISTIASEAQTRRNETAAEAPLERLEGPAPTASQKDSDAKPAVATADSTAKPKV